LAEQDSPLFVEYAPKDRTLIIDEVQKAPHLLSDIKKAVDEDNRPGQYMM